MKTPSLSRRSLFSFLAGAAALPLAGRLPTAAAYCGGPYCVEYRGPVKKYIIWRMTDRRIIGEYYFTEALAIRHLRMGLRMLDVIKTIERRQVEDVGEVISFTYRRNADLRDLRCSYGDNRWIEWIFDEHERRRQPAAGPALDQVGAVEHYYLEAGNADADERGRERAGEARSSVG